MSTMGPWGPWRFALPEGLIGIRRRSVLVALLGPPLAWAQAGELQMGRSRIDIQLDDDLPAALAPAVRAWAAHAAQVARSFLGELPLPAFELLVQAVDGEGVKNGTTFGEPEPYIRVRLGRATRPEQLSGDWVLLHELMHLAMPRVARAHSWLHEGMATYCQGLALVTAGEQGAAGWWGGLARNLPLGQPEAGDGGLDHTPTWGRTYWGGAMFWLLADVALRRAGAPERGLREALRGLNGAGGNYSQVWPVERILGTMDEALGVKVLRPLYEQHAHAAITVDLGALWRSLGIDPASKHIDDAAPLAAIRRAITA